MAWVGGGKKAVSPDDNELTGLGWRLATFALERLDPIANGLTTQTEVWGAYCIWCAVRNEEPIAVAFFDREFAQLAEAAGIERVQIGANVYFPGVALKGER